MKSGHGEVDGATERCCRSSIVKRVHFFLSLSSLSIFCFLYLCESLGKGTWSMKSGLFHESTKLAFKSERSWFYIISM